jgi:hypothetical protein
MLGSGRNSHLDCCEMYDGGSGDCSGGLREQPLA